MNNAIIIVGEKLSWVKKIKEELERIRKEEEERRKECQKLAKDLIKIMKKLRKDDSILLQPEKPIEGGFSMVRVRRGYFEVKAGEVEKAMKLEMNPESSYMVGILGILGTKKEWERKLLEILINPTTPEERKLAKTMLCKEMKVTVSEST